MPPSEPSFAVAGAGTPDRSATVGRHTVRLRGLDSRSPLQVGNGEFALAVDPTGMQTFPEAYPVAGGGSLLGTMAQWAWHSLPAARPYSLSQTVREYDMPRGPVPYVDLSGDLSGESHDGAGQTDAESWLRGNPHKLQLAVVGLWTGARTGAGPGGDFDVTDLDHVDQRLDLWTGVIDSGFRLGGDGYRTLTASHPERDAVAFHLTGPPGVPLGVRLRFPYGSGAWGNASDWTRPEAHTTSVRRAASGWLIERRLDETSYTVFVHGDGLELRELGEHDLVFIGEGPAAGAAAGATAGSAAGSAPGSAAGSARLVVEFLAGTEASGGRAPSHLTTFGVIAASTAAWAEFWSSGAAIDLSASSDQRAPELERRIVLSQYLTAVNCAGSLPPAETGLLLNSWRGKFHLEMHPFHALHFPAWGRPRQLERSLAWYQRVLDRARETASSQGYAGARWPKQVGPAGEETPSSIGPFLVWQQPHLIYLLEVLYRARPGGEVLERYAGLLFETAEFMASFVESDADGFHLGPPIVPAQESYFAARGTSRDPTFELAYWSWGLNAASDWWERLGRDPPARWREVARGMAPPRVWEGTYAALATPPYLLRDDHPSMLAALGLVPATSVIDAAIMSRTYDDALSNWDWDSTWGWDYPVAAMTAARLGRVEDGSFSAVDALLLGRKKNEYLANGHNFQADRLPVYLPGNGGLLLAAALLAGGWDGSGPTPGFGDGWRVAHEGFVRLP